MSALDGVLLAVPVAAERRRRLRAASVTSAWFATATGVATGVATSVATSVATPCVAGSPGLAMASVVWAKARGGWEERSSTKVMHDVHEGSRGTVLAAVLSFGTGTGAHSSVHGICTVVGALTEECTELLFLLGNRIVPTPVFEGGLGTRGGRGGG